MNYTVNYITSPWYPNILEQTPLTQSLTHSLTYSLTYPLTYRLTDLLVYNLNCIEHIVWPENKFCLLRPLILKVCRLVLAFSY